MSYRIGNQDSFLYFKKVRGYLYVLLRDNTPRCPPQGGNVEPSINCFFVNARYQQIVPLRGL